MESGRCLTKTLSLLCLLFGATHGKGFIMHCIPKRCWILLMSSLWRFRSLSDRLTGCVSIYAIGITSIPFFGKKTRKITTLYNKKFNLSPGGEQRSRRQWMSGFSEVINLSFGWCSVDGSWLSVGKCSLGPPEFWDWVRGRPVPSLSLICLFSLRFADLADKRMINSPFS